MIDRRRPISRSRRVGLRASLVLPLAMIAATGLADGKPPKPASLTLSVPSQVKKGTLVPVKASGYSGKFNALTFYSHPGGPCGKTKADEGKHYTGYRYDLSPKTNFSKTLKFSSTHTGTNYACVYLWTFGQPAATDQLHKGKSYQVVP